MWVEYMKLLVLSLIPPSGILNYKVIMLDIHQGKKKAQNKFISPLNTTYTRNRFLPLTDIC